jgi:hypothetical protein
MVLLAIALPALHAGCERKQLAKVDPALLDGRVTRIGVLPFTSGVAGDWPSACLVMDELLAEKLETREDFTYLSTGKMTTAFEMGHLEADAGRWLAARGKRGEFEREFLEDLSRVVNLDAVLVGVVDWWGSAQDEPDAPSSVAASLAIVAMDGRVIFETSEKIHVLGEDQADYLAGRGRGVAKDMIDMLVERIPHPRKVDPRGP